MKKFNIQKVIQQIPKLFLELPQKRDRDIFIKRFSLNGARPLTLQVLGDQHGISRERVRQIVDTNLEYLRKRKVYTVFQDEFALIRKRLAFYGKIAEEKKIIKDFFYSPTKKEEAHFLFLLHLGKDFVLNKETGEYKRSWALAKDEIKRVKQFIQEVIECLHKQNRVLSDQALFNHFQQEYKRPINFEIFFNLLNLSKQIECNVFGEWGLAQWSDVNPRRVCDKAYLVLKHEKSPMHFQELADRINQIRIGKPAHSGTLHNELIKDKRFVLVGRGIYALQEWGYQQGTVKEILLNLLKDNQQGIERERLIQEVLKRKFVQKPTVILNLRSAEFKMFKNGIVRLKKSIDQYGQEKRQCFS